MPASDAERTGSEGLGRRPEEVRVSATSDAFATVVDLPTQAEREASAKADTERQRIAALILGQADGWRSEVRRWLAETDPATRTDGMPAEHLRAPSTRVVQRYLMPGEKPVIVSTGFRDLDEYVSLEPETLVVIGARSGRGKSCLSLQFSMNVATRHDGASLFFSSEMSSEQLALRAMCMMASVDAKRVRRGAVADNEFARLTDACNDITRSFAWITDEPGLDVMRVRQRAKREMKVIAEESGQEVKLVVVDYLQRIKAGKAAPAGANREQQVAAIAYELKELAREMKVCVVVPAQLNADGDTRKDDRPTASDLRESKGIENEADVVLLIHNPHHIERMRDPQHDHSEPEACELIVAKGRNDGTGNVPIWFTPMYTRFTSMSDTDKRDFYEASARSRSRGAEKR
jgi:replicative DNA helicase